MAIPSQLINKLERLDGDLEKFQKDFFALCDQYAKLEEEKRKKQCDIEKKYEPETDKLNSLKKDLRTFYEIIKRYDQKEKGIVDNYVKKRELDPHTHSQLYDMLEKLEKSRSDDVVAHRIADQIVDVINSIWSDANDKLKELEARKDKEVSDSVDVRELSDLVTRQKELISDMKSYTLSESVKNLSNAFENIYSAYKITDDYFMHWDEQDAAPLNLEMLLGIQQRPVKVSKYACEEMKKSFGRYFNFDAEKNKRTLSCPLVFYTDSFEDITVEYTDKNESCMKGGIQALILNFIRCFTTGFRVSLLDYIHYNADLSGPLAVLSKGKNCLIDRAPHDENSMRWSISVLADYYRKVENKIGTLSVYEYNKQCKAEQRIPLRIMIINKRDEMFSSAAGSDISYVLNNARKFGITIIKLLQISDERKLLQFSDDRENGCNREHSNYADDVNRERIISDADGNFYVESEKDWLPFEWLSSPAVIPADFIAKVQKFLKPDEIGTKYFRRYEMHLPQKSANERNPIVLPFAVDDDDNVINCRFENENFAAYVMGASGSGKSTMLHTLIAGILMNYHPDEVELWLLDFKMTEFKKYVDCRPPHIKYLLLEKSEDLVFDIIDRLTEILNTRQRLFSRNHWSKLTDVPLDQNMPAIFVIIDEFAQMSQILKETRGMGYDKDYTLKLENLLAQGRALGFKFIFASQTYTDGVTGLTDTAKKQIQMRFAMKNTVDEIRQTLNLTLNEITPEINNNIITLPAYETLFKWQDEAGIHIEKYRNMYVDNGEIETVINKINSAMKPVERGCRTDNSSYVDKLPVLIDGNEPKTFESQLEYYTKWDGDDDTELFIYPGVPCSFIPAKPFSLCNATGENILLTGGRMNEKISVLLSVLKSYKHSGNDIEMWFQDEKSAKKYKGFFGNAGKISDLSEICGRISKIKSDILNRTVRPGLIVCMEYENIAAGFELLGSDSAKVEKPQNVFNKSETPSPDEVLKMVSECSDPKEKRRIIDEYNKKLAMAKENSRAETEVIYDARSDMKSIVTRASLFGLHFLFYFERANDFVNIHIDGRMFKHKILFSMSNQESFSIMGSRKASDIGDGVFIYTDDRDICTMRPHIFKGVTLNGWSVDEEGNIVQMIQ